jgi:ATP-grasp domain
MTTISRGFAAAEQEQIDGDARPDVLPPGVQKGRPTVVFVDDGDWESFVQLAAGIRRAGIRTFRITTSPRSLATSLSLFDRTIHLCSLSELDDLAGILDGENVTDMQMTENVAEAISKGLSMMPRSGHTHALTRRLGAMDKTFVARRLREFGLSTPRIMTGPHFNSRHIVEELGLPVVRKLRIGSGGEGISIITSHDELEELIANDQRSDEYFFEEFIEGRELQFGGVFGGRGDDVIVTYETLQRRGALAPASQIRLLEDLAIAQTGRRIVAALGITGIMNINVIRDATGRDWVHDVNPRVFGSFLAFRPAGVDLLQSYIDWVLVSARLPVSPASSLRSMRPDDERDTPVATTDTKHVASSRPGQESWVFLVFPAAFRNHSLDENPLRTVGRFCRGAYPYLRWVGPRYVAYEVGRQLRFEVERLWRRYETRTNANTVKAKPAVQRPANSRI